MKDVLKAVASVLLLINSIGAIFGGGNLIDHPDGSSLVLSLDWLKHSPFHDYLIPGIILFITNGLFGFAVLAIMFFGFRKYALFIIAQGAILIGWLVIQVVMIQTLIGLHVFTFTIGLLLVLIGWMLNKMDQAEMKKSKVKFKGTGIYTPFI